MTQPCRIEFYFKTEDLLKMINANPNANGIIVSQEIRKEKPKGMDHYVNITHITARPDHKLGAKAATAGPGDGGDESIDGCPYPPGCN